MGTAANGPAFDPAVYRALTEHASDLVLILEPDGTVRYASPSWQRLLGYRPQEVQGTSVFAGIHPDDVERVQSTFRAAMHADDGVPVQIQCRCRHADGSWRVLATTGSSHLADPSIQGFITSSHDISERVQVEADLREKEEQYRAIFEASGDGLVIADVNGSVVEANPAMCRMYGYSYDEMLGRHVSVRQAEGSAQYQARAINQRKDGSSFHVEGHVISFTYKGKPHFLAVVRDISERVKAEEQLREKEEQYRSIFEATGDGLVIMDRDGTIVEANPAFCAMYGYTRDELIGMHNSSVVSPDYHPALARHLEVIQVGESIQEHEIGVRKDGSQFHVEAHGTPFVYKGAPHVLGVDRDVTERVRAHELLEQRVAERTRELSTLLEVSHNVASTLELQSLLDLILDQLKKVVDYTGAGLAVEDGEVVRIIGYRGPDQGGLALGTRIPVTEVGPLWQLMRRSEPLRIPDVLADSPMARIYRETVGDALDTTFAYVRSWMAVPMRIKDRDVGSLFFEHSEPDRYTAHHADLALAIAQQAAIAIENARLYEQAQAAAVLEERQRLARELHDSVSQALYGIGLGVRTAQLQLVRDPDRVVKTLDYLRDLAQTGLAEMRALIFELLPNALETEGVVAALDRQIAAISARHGIEVHASLGAEPDVPLAVKEAIYRIAQEALHNAVKHAQPQSVEVRLEGGSEELVLQIRDDGTGFDTGSSFPGHLGLRTMRERAIRLGGTLALESAPRSGTRICARIPRSRR